MLSTEDSKENKLVMLSTKGRREENAILLWTDSAKHMITQKV